MKLKLTCSNPHHCEVRKDSHQLQVQKPYKLLTRYQLMCCIHLPTTLQVTDTAWFEYLQWIFYKPNKHFRDRSMSGCSTRTILLLKSRRASSTCRTVTSSMHSNLAKASDNRIKLSNWRTVTLQVDFPLLSPSRCLRTV